LRGLGVVHVQGFGLRFEGPGVRDRVKGSGFEIEDLGFRLYDARFRFRGVDQNTPEKSKQRRFPRRLQVG
jgi:hypothetical protein